MNEGSKTLLKMDYYQPVRDQFIQKQMYPKEYRKDFFPAKVGTSGITYVLGRYTFTRPSANIMFWVRKRHVPCIAMQNLGDYQ